jgi:hypothetical protein
MCESRFHVSFHHRPSFVPVRLPARTARVCYHQLSKDVVPEIKRVALIIHANAYGVGEGSARDPPPIALYALACKISHRLVAGVVVVVAVVVVAVGFVAVVATALFSLHRTCSMLPALGLLAARARARSAPFARIAYPSSTPH